MAAKEKSKQVTVPALRLSSTVSVPLKYICLGTLVIQTSTMVLTMRYSRSVKSGRVYLSSTAVCVSEILKILTCFVVLWRQMDNSVIKLIAELRTELVLRWTDSLKLTVPAILYTVQNNLLFIALSYLDAATYQVTYQLKILTTAMFSVVLLGKRLNPLKWVSLVILMVGVAFVQMPDGSKKVSGKDVNTPTRLFGLLAVLTACFSSGFAGVYFEKLLKSSKVSIWMRNVQLAFYGIIFGFIGVLFNDWQAVKANGFFQGYNGLTLFIVSLQIKRAFRKCVPLVDEFATGFDTEHFNYGRSRGNGRREAFGGLLVAAVVKYADNILKGFATSISIVLSSILSYYFIGDFNPSLYFVIGASGVLLATYLYSLPVVEKPHENK